MPINSLMEAQKLSKKEAKEVLEAVNAVAKVLDSFNLKNKQTELLLALLWGGLWFDAPEQTGDIALVMFFGKCTDALETLRKEECDG